MPAPSSLTAGQAQLPYFQLVRPPAKANRACLILYFEHGSSKKRLATFIGAAYLFLQPRYNDPRQDHFRASTGASLGPGGRTKMS
jgi:hypothetical protein